MGQLEAIPSTSNRRIREPDIQGYKTIQGQKPPQVEILMLEDQYAPGMVPHVYFFDTVMCACGMEDCSDYAVMRDHVKA